MWVLVYQVFAHVVDPENPLQFEDFNSDEAEEQEEEEETVVVGQVYGPSLPGVAVGGVLVDDGKNGVHSQVPRGSGEVTVGGGKGKGGAEVKVRLRRRRVGAGDPDALMVSSESDNEDDAEEDEDDEEEGGVGAHGGRSGLGETHSSQIASYSVQKPYFGSKRALWFVRVIYTKCLVCV